MPAGSKSKKATPENLRLFMFYVGGDCENSNIELHDVRFSVGVKAQDCYDDLRAQWWGIPKSLHLDSWVEVTQVDGYDVVLLPEPFEGDKKLYFLNLGGYNSTDFEEVHKNVLVVAENQATAIKESVRALSDWIQPHKDAVLEMEKALLVSEQIREHGLHVHLTKSVRIAPLKFNAKYIRLNR